MSDQGVREVHITLGPRMGGKVVVDGQDISKYVRQVVIRGLAGDIPIVELELLPQVVTVEGFADLTATREVVVRPSKVPNDDSGTHSDADRA